MKLNEYQELSKRTMPTDDGTLPTLKWNLSNYAMGLSGEAGETTDYLKKFIHHNHEIEEQKVLEEIGDVLHYAAGLCSLMGLNLEDAATSNIDKLRKRYPQGFSTDASIKRVDVK